MWRRGFRDGGGGRAARAPAPVAVVGGSPLRGEGRRCRGRCARVLAPFAARCSASRAGSGGGARSGPAGGCLAVVPPSRSAARLPRFRGRCFARPPLVARVTSRQARFRCAEPTAASPHFRPLRRADSAPPGAGPGPGPATDVPTRCAERSPAGLRPDSARPEGVGPKADDAGRRPEPTGLGRDRLSAVPFRAFGTGFPAPGPRASGLYVAPGQGRWAEVPGRRPSAGGPGPGHRPPWSPRSRPWSPPSFRPPASPAPGRSGLLGPGPGRASWPLAVPSRSGPRPARVRTPAEDLRIPDAASAMGGWGPQPRLSVGPRPAWPGDAGSPSAAFRSRPRPSRPFRLPWPGLGSWPPTSRPEAFRTSDALPAMGRWAEGPPRGPSRLTPNPSAPRPPVPAPGLRTFRSQPTVPAGPQGPPARGAWSSVVPVSPAGLSVPVPSSRRPRLRSPDARTRKARAPGLRPSGRSTPARPRPRPGSWPLSVPVPDRSGLPGLPGPRSFRSPWPVCPFRSPAPAGPRGPRLSRRGRAPGLPGIPRLRPFRSPASAPAGLMAPGLPGLPGRCGLRLSRSRPPAALVSPASAPGGPQGRWPPRPPRSFRPPQPV